MHCGSQYIKGLSHNLPVRAPNARGMACTRVQAQWPRVPKREVAINPINPRGGLAILAPLPLENRGFLIRFSSVQGRV